jgi:hypothetical protein
MQKFPYRIYYTWVQKHRLHLQYSDFYNISLLYVFTFWSVNNYFNYDSFHQVCYSLTSESMAHYILVRMLRSPHSVLRIPSRVVHSPADGPSVGSELLQGTDLN